LGTPKQLLALEGESLVRRVARSLRASRCERVFAVVGAHAAEVSRELEDLPVSLLENARWEEGMATSIHAGVAAAAALIDPAIDAVLLALVDQLAVGAALFDRLIAALASAPAGLVAAQYGGSVGAPALFSRRHFPGLLALSGDRGGKAILAAHGDAVVAVPFPEGSFDIDTPEDLERARAR
jgi:molybdenum cofactor cytidylyltransferase